MKDLIILGAGGLAQELVWLVEEINDHQPEWNFLGYLDSHPDVQGMDILGYPVLGGFEDYRNYKDAWFIVAFGDARYREEVVNMVDGKVNWATLISPTVRIHPTNKIGKGVVIGRYTDMTIDCTIHDHVMLNIHVVLGHKVEIGKYSIVSPNVTLNGGATIGQSCSIGANAFVRDIVIGDRVVIGASSCVVKATESDCVVAGVPAKVIRQGKPKHSVTTSLRKDS
jgi:sugar O-acyltransferase (sialic acid O-acetyltransferase NeuD family)